MAIDYPHATFCTGSNFQCWNLATGEDEFGQGINALFQLLTLSAKVGRSGKSIEALSFGGEGDAEKTVQLVKDCMAIAKSAGKTYSVWAYAWAQGETNYTGT